MPPTTLSAFHPSPKRKRDQAPPIPLLNTALRPASTPPRGSPTPDGADSPRNTVAEQLRGMTLTSIAAIPMSPLTPTDDIVRKKPKLEEMRVDSGISLDAISTAAIAKHSSSARNGDAIAGNVSNPSSKGSAWTPQAQTQPRIFSNHMVSFAQPTPFVSSSTGALATAPETAGHGSRLKSRTSQPRQRKKSPSPPLSVLTWQDSEITGHLAGPATDPDDDGTGLNGIGFKPTPAMAYARAQKRRQQVLDWKAREAREARAKRSERRRRGVGGTPSREATVEREVPAVEEILARRSVKFAI